uniref:tRNA (cytosine(34)-C(5))-methyltransferase n=1 Tax=Myxobolus squamalis TaxID=59785 RepID=A0A6B2G098_MYXSQ
MEPRKRKATELEHMSYKNINLDRVNEEFDSFYRNLIVPESWDKFKEILKITLPTSFRINSINKIGDYIFKYLHEKHLDNMSEISNLSWYPGKRAWQLNLSKKELKNNKNYEDFYRYLTNETAFGSISRQESVSMIPPLVLDISPNHVILDMCASPGSKTAQLLESLCSTGTIPEGFVVANDMNLNRCCTLVAQMKRINSPCLFVTCEDARCYPSLLKQSECNTKYLQFDRVLCDVPCSGDGTIRKNIDVYSKWKFKTSYDLHFMQRDILQRGLELLKVGGYLVYSTCSMNPIENEAVIYSILKQYNGYIKCINFSEKLNGLIYESGINEWNFANKLKFAYKRGLIESPTSDEYLEFQLNNCIRIYPHFQNTGGFFVALLYKEREIVIKNQEVVISPNTKLKMTQKLKYKANTKNFARPLLETDPEWRELTSFFGMRNIRSNNLIIRSENDAKNTIYYINDQMASFLSLNNDRVRIVSCGAKIFGRSSFKRLNTTCNFRIVQESIDNFVPLVTKRIITLEASEFEILLINEDVYMTKIKHFSDLNDYEQGSVIFSTIVNELDIIYVAGHIGIHHARLMINNIDRIHFLVLIGYDVLKAMDLCQNLKKIEKE